MVNMQVQFWDPRVEARPGIGGQNFKHTLRPLAESVSRVVVTPQFTVAYMEVFKKHPISAELVDKMNTK